MRRPPRSPRRRWCAAALALALAACRAEVPLLAGVPEPPPPPADAGPPEPVEVVTRVLRGKAIWYGGVWHGRRTASGEPFDKEALTAAHRSLPLGTRLRVVDLGTNGRGGGTSVVVRVNDRGPYGRDRSRIIDLSERAARELGFLDRGWTRVELHVLAEPDAGPSATP